MGRSAGGRAFRVRAAFGEIVVARPLTFGALAIGFAVGPAFAIALAIGALAALGARALCG